MSIEFIHYPISQELSNDIYSNLSLMNLLPNNLTNIIVKGARFIHNGECEIIFTYYNENLETLYEQSLIINCDLLYILNQSHKEEVSKLLHNIKEAEKYADRLRHECKYYKVFGKEG